MRDLFPGYYKPKLSEEQLFKEGIFVFDTNILLNFYRYSEITREQLFRSMEVVKKRIWLPYQAASEFQRRRFDVIRGERKAYEETIKHFNAIEGEFRKLANKQRKGTTARLALDEAWLRYAADSQEAVKHLEECIKRAVPTSLDDPLRDRIDALFQGKVGKIPTEESIAKQRKEAQRRIAAKIPPGYMDAKNKDEEGAQGDCLMWLQTLEYMGTQKKPLIFVSDDIKEDWYWEVDGQKIGPRVELVEEVRTSIGVDLVLYDSANFLKKISRFYFPDEATQNIDDAVEEARQVQKEENQATLASRALDLAVDYFQQSLFGENARQVPLSNDDKVRLKLLELKLKKAIRVEMDSLGCSLTTSEQFLIAALNDIWELVPTAADVETTLDTCRWISTSFKLAKDSSAHPPDIARYVIHHGDSFLMNHWALQIFGLNDLLQQHLGTGAMDLYGAP